MQITLCDSWRSRASSSAAFGNRRITQLPQAKLLALSFSLESPNPAAQSSNRYATPHPIEVPIVVACKIEAEIIRPIASPEKGINRIVEHLLGGAALRTSEFASARFRRRPWGCSNSPQPFTAVAHNAEWLLSECRSGPTESATGLLSSELSSCNFGFGSRVKRRILLSDRSKHGCQPYQPKALDFPSSLFVGLLLCNCTYPELPCLLPTACFLDDRRGRVRVRISEGQG